MGKEKLNLGCGPDPIDGFVNVDIEDFGQDVIHDLNIFPYPFKDDQFEFVLMNHSLEHLKEPVDVIRELCRISKRGTRIQIVVPYFSSPNMWSDPTHKSCYNWHTWERFNGVKILRRKLMYLSNSGFMKSKSLIMDTLINMNQVIFQRFFCYILPPSEIHVELEVI